MRYPHIIKNRYGVYCFRLVVPLELQRMGAPREIRLSLLTKNSALLAESFPFALLSAKSLLRDLHNLTSEHKGTMAEQTDAIKVTIEKWREKHHERTLRAQQEDDNWENVKALKHAEWALQERNQQITDITHKVLQKEGELHATREQVSRLTSELSSKPAIQGSDELLSELIAKFLTVGAEQEKLKKKTISARKSNLNRFLDIIGDMPCCRLNDDFVRFYRDVIHSMPKNLTKQEVWKTYPKTQQDKIDWYKNLHTHGLERLTEGGQKSHFDDVKPFFKWLAQERKHSENYADMLSPIKNDDDYDNSVIPLNPAEMETLVEKHFKPAPKISRNEQPKDWHFWGPLIALTTGLRSEEIGSLTVQQVQANFHGTAVIKANGEKNDNAKRTVPIPQTLLDAGFLEYVELMKTNAASMSNGGRIFPDWKLGGKKDAKTYSATMTKFFCRQKTTKDGKPHYSGLVVRLGLDSEERRFTFHGLRKTLINAAYHSGVELKKIQTIAGHHADLYDTYGLPKGYADHTDVTFNYIHPDSAYSSDVEAALADLKAQIDSVNFGYSLAGINWQAWCKSKTKKGLKA